MNLSELVDNLAEKHNMTKTAVREVLEDFFSTVESKVATDENVKLSGFGVFSKKVIQPRRTPQGGMSEGRTTIRFRATRKDEAGE